MGMAEACQVLTKRAIETYTRLSPAAFLTVLAVAAVLYDTMAGFLAPPPPPQRTREAEPLPPPVQIGETTEEELRAYDGYDLKKPLLMAVKARSMTSLRACFLLSLSIYFASCRCELVS